MSRDASPPCQSDLACFRNDGHTGNHAYPLDTTKPQPVAPTPPDALREAARLLSVLAQPSSELPDRYIVHGDEMRALRAALRGDTDA